MVWVKGAFSLGCHGFSLLKQNNEDDLWHHRNQIPQLFTKMKQKYPTTT